MRARTCLMVAVALSGCASSAPDVMAPEIVTPLGATTITCESSTCEVPVTVGAGCTFDPAGFTLDVRTPGSADVLITWTISSASSGKVVFTANGIDPKPGYNGPWHSEFKHPTPGSTTFSWVDKNKTKRKPYGYNIFVTQDGVACPAYDPIIINN